MIKNEKQYHITQARLREFQTDVERLERERPARGVQPRVHMAQIDAAKSQIETFRRELREYEELKAGDRLVRTYASLEDLPRALIEARIARGWSQEQLADRLGLDRQQISDYEKTDYQRASFAKLVEVARALNLEIREEVRLA